MRPNQLDWKENESEQKRETLSKCVPPKWATSATRGAVLGLQYAAGNKPSAAVSIKHMVKGSGLILYLFVTVYQLVYLAPFLSTRSSNRLFAVELWHEPSLHRTGCIGMRQNTNVSPSWRATLHLVCVLPWYLQCLPFICLRQKRRKEQIHIPFCWSP